MSIYTGTYSNLKNGNSRCDVRELDLSVIARDEDLHSQTVEAIYYATGDKDAEIDWVEA